VQRQELTDAFRISVPIAVPGMARNWAIIVTLPYKVVLAGADELARQLTDMNRAAMTQQLIGALLVLVLALAPCWSLPAASRAPSARWSAW
jgi:methyl-accepting chemotaxis protein